MTLQIAKSLQKYFLISLKAPWLWFLWQDEATDCVKPKTNATPFEVTRQDKMSHWANLTKDIIAGQPG